MAAGGSADLSARLQRLPSDGRRIVLVRAALRGFAGIARVGEGPWSFGGAIERPIIVQALRVIFVAWAQSAFDGVRPEALGEATRALQAELAKFDDEFASYYRQNVMGSDYACGAWQQNAEAGRRAANLAEWAGRGEMRRWSFDEPHAYRDDFDTLVELQLKCFPGMKPWAREQIASQLAIFPEGQIVIEVDGRIVGSSSSLIVDSSTHSDWHDWRAVTVTRAWPRA